MANVTSPIMLDSTGQTANSHLSSIKSSLETIASNSGSGGGSDAIRISVGVDALIDGVTALPTGELYLMLNDNS